MSYENVRHQLRAMVERPQPQFFETLADALQHPATEYTAFCVLKDLQMAQADALLLRYVTNGGQRSEAEAWQIIRNIKTMVDIAARKCLQQHDSFPLAALLTAMEVSTGDEYADFLAWRATLKQPLLTVCVIDDLVGTRTLIKIIVNRMSDALMVGSANDALEGGEMVHHLQPDVILLDDVMPGLSGADAVRYIRAASPQSVIIVRAYAYNRAEAILEMMDAGANDVISQMPLFHNDLSKSIHTAYTAAMNQRKAKN